MAGMLGREPRWQPGQTILVQDVWRGLLWTARPLTVVQDHGDFLALWMPEGTVWQGSVSPPTRPRSEERAERVLSSLELCDWVLQERQLGLSLLWLLEADTGYAVTLSFDEAGDARNRYWYVNLQEPFRRTAHGIETMDLMLDVIVRRDGSWSWKDEDEFEGACQRGLVSAEKSLWLREQGLRAIERINANEEPFSDRWRKWRPDPSWHTPVLPDDWGLVEPG
jgi:predicted RNA-binding protein associated with RNAse of E/G family